MLQRPARALLHSLTLAALWGACADPEADTVGAPSSPANGAPSSSGTSSSGTADAAARGAAADGATTSANDAAVSSTNDAIAPDSAVTNADAAVATGNDASAVVPLPALPYAKGGLAVDGVSGAYDGIHDRTWNGNVMLGSVLDPNGSGVRVDLHRIMEAAPFAWGTTHRSEILWLDEPQYALPPGVDTWQSFAVMRKPGEALPDNPISDDAMLLAQSHSPEYGDTYPPYSLVVKRQGTDEVRWYVSYNTHPVSDWPTYGDVEAENMIHAEPLMPEGQWYRYVMHYRAGFQSSHAPIFEVWRAKPGQPFEKLFSHTGMNAYNGGDGYPRIGPYKWDDQWNGQSSLAYYMTPLHYGRGANLYDAAVAAVAGL